MKIKKLVSVLAVCFLMVVVCYGCTKEPLAYNAKLIVDINENERRIIPTNMRCFSCNFWRENLVRAIYFNEDYNSDDEAEDDEGNFKYIGDETAPVTILHIVTDEKEYNHIFDSGYRFRNKGWVDFENEMLIVYVYTGVSNYEKYLTGASLDGKILKIEYDEKVKSNNKKNVASPTRRVLVIKLDKLDIETMELVHR